MNLISGYSLGAVKLTKGWKSCCDLTYLQHHKLGQSKTRFTHDDFGAWQVALGENQQAYIRTNTSNLKTARETIYGRAACLGFVEVWIYSSKHRSVIFSLRNANLKKLWTPLVLSYMGWFSQPQSLCSYFVPKVAYIKTSPVFVWSTVSSSRPNSRFLFHRKRIDCKNGKESGFFNRFSLNSRRTKLKIFFLNSRIFSKLKQILNLNSKIR